MVPRIHAGEVGLTVAIDENVILHVFLTGKLTKDGLFQIETTGLKIETLKNRARFDFIASTLWAMLGISETVQIRVSEMHLNLNLKVQMELSTISEMLQRRLLAYRIMVIERATGKHFDLPPFITPENVKGVALIYHAISSRSFAWPIGFVDYGFPATKEVRDTLVEINKLPVIKLGPHPHAEALFGQLIPIGEAFVTVKDKTIADFDRVVKELSANDEHMVRVLIRSATGQGAYDFPNAPRLPKSPWDPKIQALVDLETGLDAQLLERYNQLAAGTLANLSEEERKEITNRPELDEEAFVFESND